MANLSSSGLDSIEAGAPGVAEQYAERLSRAPTIVTDPAGRLVFAFNGGQRVVAVEASGEMLGTQASSPK
jgi:hypothetical protein